MFQALALLLFVTKLLLLVALSLFYNHVNVGYTLLFTPGSGSPSLWSTVILYISLSLRMLSFGIFLWGTL